MGNQPSMGNVSTRFTLRGLSWRPPKKSLPPLPGENPPPPMMMQQQQQQQQQMPPPPNQQYRRSEFSEGVSDDGEWDDEDGNSNRGSWLPWKSKRFTKGASANMQSDTMRKKMASTMFEASQQKVESQRMGKQGGKMQSVRNSGVSGWSEASAVNKGPEYKELYDKLVQFYMKHDPDAVRNKEIDISGMTSWCLESEEGSLEELNEKLFDRFGETLDDFEDDGPVRSAVPTATANRSDNGTNQSPSPIQSFQDSESEEEEDDDDWDQESEFDPFSRPAGGAAKATEDSDIRDELERFFLQYEPESLGDIDDFIDEYENHGRTALNVKLFRSFGKNLTSMTGTKEARESTPSMFRASSAPSMSASRKGSVRKGSMPPFSDVTPEAMGGGTMQSGSVRKASKFGVHLAPDEVLGEMRKASLKPSSNAASAFPDFTAKRKKSIEEHKKQSNVSASLQRKWNHLANRNRGISTRISTRISSKFSGKSPQQQKPTAVAVPGPTFASTASKSKPPAQPQETTPSPVLPRSASKAATPIETMPKKVESGCSRFQINLSGEFGTCKNCGRKKADHFVQKGPKLAPTLARRWQKIGTTA